MDSLCLVEREGPPQTLRTRAMRLCGVLLAFLAINNSESYQIVVGHSPSVRDLGPLLVVTQAAPRRCQIHPTPFDHDVHALPASRPRRLRGRHRSPHREGAHRAPVRFPACSRSARERWFRPGPLGIIALDGPLAAAFDGDVAAPLFADRGESRRSSRARVGVWEAARGDGDGQVQGDGADPRRAQRVGGRWSARNHEDNRCVAVRVWQTVSMKTRCSKMNSMLHCGVVEIWGEG